ncbi:cobalt/magnesium transport protein CorA [Endomicrobiia bacterium]|nr:cobalt/magnesium transport protein CorA [Endomicrobiia bacterium]
MIEAIYSINDVVAVECDAFKIAEDYKKNPSFMWVDIQLEDLKLTGNEMVLLLELFKFHEMSIEDCLFPQKYSKIEEFENYVFIVVHGIQLESNYFKEFEDSIYELDVFVGKDFIVTVHMKELFFLESLFARAKERYQVEMKSLEHMLYSIFDKVVLSYESTSDRIDSMIERLEDVLLKHPESENMEEILDLKKIIFAMRRTAESQQAAYIYFTRGNNSLISAKYLVYFRDIYTQYTRMNLAMVTRSQVVVSLMEIYMSSITVKLTEIMKLLTIFATIFLPVLAVTGYYGMNVDIPKGHNNWNCAVRLMAVGITMLFVYFKKKKWF